MPNKSKPSKDEIGILILFAAILFGGIFHLLPPWLAGFPVNDGGMFYVMMKDLQANHYIPPLYTSYNQINIPFAYPPLAFYIGAGLSDLIQHFIDCHPAMAARHHPYCMYSSLIFSCKRNNRG